VTLLNPWLCGLQITDTGIVLFFLNLGNESIYLSLSSIGIFLLVTYAKSLSVT